MNSVWISALGLCGASIIGSVIGYFVKDMPHRWNDAVLGYCAGIMLAASTVGLILPAVEAVEGYAVWLGGGRRHLRRTVSESVGYGNSSSSHHHGT